MDLDGFEPSTSSMPFKKHQSLTDILAQNKGLSRRRLDAGGHHRVLFGRLDAIWTPGHLTGTPALRFMLGRGSEIGPAVEHTPDFRISLNSRGEFPRRTATYRFASCLL